MDYRTLIQVLKNPPSLKRPVILPDFFLDHFVVQGNLEAFIKGLRGLAEQGGGNMMGSTQMIRRGGNSTNTAAALYALGANPVLIATTDEQGKRLLESLTFGGFELSHVHTDGSLSATVSIEVEHEGRRVNLMVSDSGSASSFDFSHLDEYDLSAITDSGLVAIMNLNHNSRAYEFAKDLLGFVKTNSEAITFMDLGDPSNNPKMLVPIMRDVVSKGYVDVFGMNENESAWIAWAIDEGKSKWRDGIKDPRTWLSTAEFVSEELGVKIDLHTPFYSASIIGAHVIGYPSFPAESRVLCGAGDAWNAGDIFGILSGLDVMDRLILANAVASLYVSAGTAEHPTTNDVIEFLKRNPKTSADATKLLKLK
jgi:sugar/nucleoside kinase (ribokinase family)